MHCGLCTVVQCLTATLLNSCCSLYISLINQCTVSVAQKMCIHDSKLIRIPDCFQVGCTNWKRVFMILNGMANSTDPLTIAASIAHHKDSIPRLSNYSSSEIKSMLQTFTKFLFVRNPFERLLSAYHNKLEQHYQSSKYFQSRFGRYIVKHYRQNASKYSLTRGDDVTFKEFAAYLVAEEEGEFNEHWKPIYHLCHPCLVSYDIIGKYETFDQDSEFILKQIGETTIVFPHAPKSSKTTSNLQKYFSTLDHKAVKQLYNVYAKDFRLFGYNLEDMLGYEAISGIND